MATLETVARALSDPIRIRILDFIAAGRNARCCSPDNPDVPEGICACDVLGDIGIAPSKLAYHTKELRSAGLISETKRGKWVYYTLNDETLAGFAGEIMTRFLSTTACGTSCGERCGSDLAAKTDGGDSAEPTAR